MIPVRVVTVAGDPDAEARIATSLARRPDAEVVLRCVDRVELLAALRGASPDLVLVAGWAAWVDREACDEAVAAQVPMVALADRPEDADALARLGILVLPPDTDAGALLAFHSSGEALPEAPAALARSLDRGGRLVSVWGPKGAPGRSTVAVELAAELARSGAATVLVDGDTYGGDLAQMLGIVEELPTIVWASRAAAAGDARLRESLRRVSPDGPAFIAGIPRPDLWEDVGEHAWRELLTTLRSSFDYVVVDAGFCLEDSTSPLGGRGRNSAARAAVRDSDHVVAVCRSDAVGLKAFLWGYQALTQLVDPDRVVVCANRAPRGEEASIAELVARHAGKRPVAYLPDDPAAFRQAVERGAPAGDLAPGSAVARGVKGLAAALGGKPRPSGVFARLAGRA